VVSERALEVDRKPTTIGNFVHVGAGAVILMGCEIGDHSVIGAGAVVLESTTVPPWSVVVGIPGRVLPERAKRFSLP
jgi:acetyltransferase-like isoleucine patch superfamily enzyme